MVLATAACSVAGKAAERLEVVPLPGPVAWDNIDRWTRMFSHDGQAGRIERCLFTAHHLHHQDKILPLLYECAVEPHFLGFADNLLSLGYLAEIVETLRLGAIFRTRLQPGRQTARAPAWRAGALPPRRGRPDDVHGSVDRSVGPVDRTASIEYDEDAFVSALLSVNIQKSFEAVSAALKAGVKLDRLITTLVLLAADRMARTPVNVDAGWGVLTMELNLAASLRTAAAAWRRIAWPRKDSSMLPGRCSRTAGSTSRSGRSLRRSAATQLDVPDEETGVRVILESIASLNVQDVGRQVLEYLNAGYSGDRLLHEMGRVMLWDDTNTQVLPTLRTVFEEWERSSGSDPRLAPDIPPGTSFWSASLATLRTFARTKTADPPRTPPCASRKERRRWKCLKSEGTWSIPCRTHNPTL